MRFYTIVHCRILCVFLCGCFLPVLAATTLFASPPVETKPKKQIRIARKLEFPFSLSTKSALAAASLKYLQAQKFTQPSREDPQKQAQGKILQYETHDQPGRVSLFGPETSHRRVHRFAI